MSRESVRLSFRTLRRIVDVTFHRNSAGVPGCRSSILNPPPVHPIPRDSLLPLPPTLGQLV